MAIFKGAGVAIVTPMHANGEVNYEKLRELIDFQINEGTDAIIICGTTGESSTLSEEEHMKVICECVTYVNKRVPVIAGTGSNSTDSAVWMSREAQECGADGLLVVTPYYNKATQNGLYLHFKTIAEAVTIPIILYSVASRTGVNIAPATVARLFHDVDNIIGIKEASGNISQVAEIMHLTDGKIDLYSGNDDQILPVLSLGGLGVISVLSNVAPRETHEMVQLYFDGKREESLALQMKYFDVVKNLFTEVNPIPVKAALNMMGMEVGSLRLPLTEMEEVNAVKLRKSLEEVGLLK
ncbi:MAG: 4-hydroxy-tetrahydrodipicolinate synthase [Clostridiales bacterium]|nr:4-hydroxy-tetrahydrodipicolinate synthase [Clostridiales bacterium]